MEELLVTLGCTNEQKVAYAAYKLTGEAKCKWHDKKVMLVADLGSKTAISWEVFKHEFNRHFFSWVAQEAKAIEFFDMVQREMSVIEYAAKFLQCVSACRGVNKPILSELPLFGLSLFKFYSSSSSNSSRARARTQAELKDEPKN